MRVKRILSASIQLLNEVTCFFKVCTSLLIAVAGLLAVIVELLRLLR